ncbi:MAG: class I SAM-dependent methyltransferase [Sedimentisphaerales bacterium]|jgi:SAM-dependent methyltransferase
MANYDRYKTVTAESLEKKDVMYYLVRILSDRKLIPFISQIKEKKILDVGPGSGRYTKLLLNDNEVVGIDRNPHLCKLPIKLHEGDATRFAELVEAHSFDMVFSTWMTEYLNPEQLDDFFKQARFALKENGEIVTTIVSKYGFGYLYITAARLLRGISKYNYSKREICDKLREAGFKEILIIDLNSWMGIPWAYVVIAS